MKFPDFLSLQTNNWCNARCTICPWKDTHGKEKYQEMPMELIEKILTDITTAYAGWVSLCFHQEPLTDHRIGDIIGLARKKCPMARVLVLSNGSLLTEEKRKILKENPPDRFGISVAGGTKETYEKIMVPLKWEDTIQKIKDFLADTNVKEFYINYVKVFDNADEWEELQKIFPNVYINHRNWATNRAGVVEVATPQSINARPCVYLAMFDNIPILYDGDILLCCNLWLREVVLGNAWNDNVLEVFNYSPLRHMNHEVCKRCR